VQEYVREKNNKVLRSEAISSTNGTTNKSFMMHALPMINPHIWASIYGGVIVFGISTL
jgi:hypothetical protein